MDFTETFRAMTGERAWTPFAYQQRLATEPWSDLLDVPTGLGKTAAVVGAWLHKRLHGDPDTPRRLVYCLPMRVLVEQTWRNVARWLEGADPLFRAQGMTTPRAYLLLGGEVEDAWAQCPEDPAILIGTQDMLLSRALMRGYGMSRYQWPVHFALLHNDALWVYDEVQLMGPGLVTSAQLDGLRRQMGTAAPTRSLWVSATLDRDWLSTKDLRPVLASLRGAGLDDEDRALPTVAQRLAAAKSLTRAPVSLQAENAKGGAKAYAVALAAEVLERHAPATQTLVVANTVGRARAVHAALRRAKPSADLLLIHSRLRPPERRAKEAALANEPGAAGRIVVATQAIEAGVDVSSRTLFTELAPWPSLVQRFGRCNRYGEVQDARVLWVDVATDQAAPYEGEALGRARSRLDGLVSASPADLPAVSEPMPATALLRRKDLTELFNTDPDLSGFDIDVSDFIRDARETDLRLFWRDLGKGRREDLEEQQAPQRDELCSAPVGEVARLLTALRRKGRHDGRNLHAHLWDPLAERWTRLTTPPRPGMVLMLDVEAGGYDPETGFAPEVREPVPMLPSAEQPPPSYPADERSVQPRLVALTDHLAHAEDDARALCAALGLADEAEAVGRAARWHDVGKAHPVFQRTLTACAQVPGQATVLWAKSPCRGRHQRRHFRHELASALAWLAQHGGEPSGDLIAYLIAAHHGKVRLGLRALPNESEPPEPKRRFARGVWEDDRLPGLELPGRESVAESVLALDLMELGEGPQGPSWAARTQGLLTEHGPFRLAWLEALVRIADWRASAREQA